MGDKGTKTTNQIELSPEARRSLSAEIGVFTDRILPEQAAMQSQLLQAMAPEQNGALSQSVLKSLALANNAVVSAGQQNGRVAEGDINRIVQNMASLEPAARDQLRAYALDTAGKTNTVIDPRFMFALRPDQLTKTEPGSGQQASQYAQIALTIAGVIAAAY